MGETLKFIFEIERKDFTEKLIRKLIDVTLNSYPTLMQVPDIAKAIDVIYNEGRGWVSSFDADFPHARSITLSALTVDNEEVISTCVKSTSAFKKPPAIGKDKCWICVSVDNRELSQAYKPAALQSLLQDLIKLYLALKPRWGRGGYTSGFGSFTVDWSQFISAFNFFTPADVKRVGKEKFDQLKVYKRIELPDGGVFVQIYPGTYEDRSKNVEFSEEDVAHLLGYLTFSGNHLK